MGFIAWFRHIFTAEPPPRTKTERKRSGEEEEEEIEELVAIDII